MTIPSNVSNLLNSLVGLERLPSKEQELLLKACLLNGDEALSSWKEWQSFLDIDLIDHSSNRLLPLLYTKLNQLGVKDEILGRYKGVYRKNWYKNQLLVKELIILLQQFHDAGIKTIVLKGAAMILNYYPNYGLRPMADLDVLVPKNQIPNALKIIETNGWKSTARITFEKREHGFFKRKKIDSDYFLIKASSGFRNKDNREFDLHAHAFPETMNSSLNDQLWENSEQIEIGSGFLTSVLSPTDNLLHVIIHGFRTGRRVNLRWIADCFTIIEKSEIEWNRLVDLAKVHGLMLQLSLGLVYVNQLLEVKIPTVIFDELIACLESSSTSSVNQLSRNNQSKFKNLSYLLSDCEELNTKKSVLSKTWALLRFIQIEYLLESKWQVPLFMVYKGVRKKI